MKRTLLIIAGLLGMSALPFYGQTGLAIANVTLIDGTDHGAREHVTVLIAGSKIVAVQDSHKRLPTGVTKVDGTGKFLIPGLWNNDLHGPAYKDAKAPLSALVANGVTTVRDMGAPLNDILQIREATASGTLFGPRIFIAGPLLEGPLPVQRDLVVDLFSEEQARSEVISLKQHGVDYIEVDTSLSPSLYRAVADEAKRQGLRLVGHIPAEVSASSIVAAGQTNVEHLGGRFLNVLISCSTEEAYFNQVTKQTYDDLLNALKEGRQAQEPQFKADYDARLLASFDEGRAERLFHEYAKNGVAQTPTLFVLKTLWETNRQSDNLNDHDVALGARIFEKDLEIIGKMKTAGEPILAGTDGTYAQGGEALHKELELLVEAGLTPLQAIQSATRDAARYMGVLASEGTIEKGKTADLVLLDANPLEDIRNTRRIDAVFLRGEMFSGAELKAMKAQ